MTELTGYGDRVGEPPGRPLAERDAAVAELVTDPAAVRAALESDEYTMPPVDQSADTGMAWLRAAVARFSDGTTHIRRRGCVVDLLATLDPGRLRAQAYDRAVEALASTVDSSAIARSVPIGVLARALGVHSDLTPAVAAAARCYLPHTQPDPEADAAVATLVAAFGGAADEPTAARIGLLMQACEATAALIAGARVADTVEAALRRDPPVRRTRRMQGDREVHLDLTTLPFGAGRHACPGREHAIAIATGVVDALRDARAGRTQPG